MEPTDLRVIARIYSDVPDKFGLPRQSGLCDSLIGRVVMEPAYRDINAFREIEHYSHLWLLWLFDQNAQSDAFSPTVRPPKLGGNTRVGVFASRTPNRPNPIGLSCVKLIRVEQSTTEGPVLIVSGIDMASGTAVVDIKPYVPYADCRPEASQGFAQPQGTLRAELSEALAAGFTDAQREALCEMLRQDPRPGYQNEDGREYGLRYAGRDVRFTVLNGTAIVTDVVPEKE